MSNIGVNGFSCPPKKKRKKRGRPRLKSGERLSVRRKLVLRPREARLLDSLAKEAGKSFNLWAREILLAVAGRI
jgi:hypothetical protein